MKTCKLLTLAAASTLGAVVCVSIAQAQVASATADRPVEQPPPPGTPHDFQLPDKVTRTLPNGLEVTFIEFGETPKVTIAAAVRAGNLDEGERTWLADLTGEMMKEGAGDRTSAQIARDAAQMGGALGVSVGPDETTVAIDVLSEYGPQAVALVADVLRRPTLPESELERLRRNFERQLALSRTQPDALANEALLAQLFPNHPYGRAYPTAGQLASYTIGDVRSFHRDNFGALRTRLYVAGRFDRAALDRAIDAAFAGWERGPAPFISPPRVAPQASVELIDRPGAAQSTIRLAIPTVDPTHPDWMSVSLMNTLLGGAFSSRITTNIREQKGFAYSPGSSLNARYRTAYWVESADVKTDSTGPALREIFAEIERLRREPPGAAELKAMQNYRAGVFVLQNATRTALIAQLDYIDLHGLPDDYLTRWVERLFALTPAQITAAAKEQLRTDAMTLVIVGDLAAIRSQLEQLPQLAAHGKKKAQ
jgi:predicted Zn-dependent peptidase